MDPADFFDEGEVGTNRALRGRSPPWALIFGHLGNVCAA